MRLLYVIIFSVAAGYCMRLNAQYNSDFLNYANTGRSVSASLNFDAGSNGLSSQLINNLIWGGYINNQEKEDASKRMMAKNNLGVNLNYNVSAFIKGTSKIDFLVSLKEQEFANATYTHDLYNLAFYGNAPYLGQTINLGSCQVNALNFQELKLGLMLHDRDSLTRFGIAVSLLKGQQLFYVKTSKNSSLYSSSDGSEVFLNSGLNMAYNGFNHSSLSSFNGLGASADVYLERVYKSKWSKKNVLIVNASNIGFIQWQNTQQYSSDTSLKFSGYQVNNFLSLKDSAINRINKDSLLNSLAHPKKGKFNTMIPANLLIINKIYFENGFNLSVGLRYLVNANYNPYAFVEPEYLYKKVTFGVHVGYGGYSRLNVGASVMWNCKGFFMKVGSNSLQGYIAPAVTFGQGVFFSVAKKFK